jgi:hypothetical protein
MSAALYIYRDPVKAQTSSGFPADGTLILFFWNFLGPVHLALVPSVDRGCRLGCRAVAVGRRVVGAAGPGDEELLAPQDRTRQLRVVIGHGNPPLSRSLYFGVQVSRRSILGEIMEGIVP